MRCGQIEIELQQRWPPLRDDQAILVRQHNLQFGLAERGSVEIGDNRLLGFTIGLDENFGVSVVQRDRSRDIRCRRNRRRGQQLVRLPLVH